MLTRFNIELVQTKPENVKKTENKNNKFHIIRDDYDDCAVRQCPPVVQHKATWLHTKF